MIKNDKKWEKVRKSEKIFGYLWQLNAMSFKFVSITSATYEKWAQVESSVIKWNKRESSGFKCNQMESSAWGQHSSLKHSSFTMQLFIAVCLNLPADALHFWHVYFGDGGEKLQPGLVGKWCLSNVIVVFDIGRSRPINDQACPCPVKMYANQDVKCMLQHSMFEHQVVRDPSSDLALQV